MLVVLDARRLVVSVVSGGEVADVSMDIDKLRRPGAAPAPPDNRSLDDVIKSTAMYEEAQRRKRGRMRGGSTLSTKEAMAEEMARKRDESLATLKALRDDRKQLRQKDAEVITDKFFNQEFPRVHGSFMAAQIERSLQRHNRRNFHDDEREVALRCPGMGVGFATIGEHPNGHPHGLEKDHIRSRPRKGRGESEWPRPFPISKADAEADAARFQEMIRQQESASSSGALRPSHATATVTQRLERLKWLCNGENDSTHGRNEQSRALRHSHE